MKATARFSDGSAAAAAYREVLRERTRERVPLEWAQAQLDLA
ncbi:MAG: hypothetical protein ACREDT_01250 [Methylocella sp.]